MMDTAADETKKLTFEKASPEDVEQLYRMIQISTCGKSKVTIESLRKDLFCYSERIKQYGRQEDVLLISAHHLEHSNKPVCQAFVVKDGSNLLGYVLYHYYYSPWDGHKLFLDDIYVEPEFRRKGIASRLMVEVDRVSTIENIKIFVFNAANVDVALIETIKRYRRAKPIRNEQSDWSVYRIKFRNDE